MKQHTCNECIFENRCSTWEKLFYNYEYLCNYFIDIDCILYELDNQWHEMSWNKYTDNLFDYIEDTTQ